MTPVSGSYQRNVAPRWGGGLIRQRALVVAGRSESWVDERAQPVYAQWRDEPLPITTTILASLGTVELQFSLEPVFAFADDR